MKILCLGWFYSCVYDFLEECKLPVSVVIQAAVLMCFTYLFIGFDIRSIMF